MPGCYFSMSIPRSPLMHRNHMRTAARFSSLVLRNHSRTQASPCQNLLSCRNVYKYLLQIGPTVNLPLKTEHSEVLYTNSKGLREWAVSKVTQRSHCAQTIEKILLVARAPPSWRTQFPPKRSKSHWKVAGGELCTCTCELEAENLRHFTPKRFGNFGRKSSGKVRFGSVRPEYLGLLQRWSTLTQLYKTSSDDKHCEITSFTKLHVSYAKQHTFSKVKFLTTIYILLQ